MKSILRFFIRCRYVNRNHELNRWAKRLQAALNTRVETVVHLSPKARAEVARNDPVLACARRIKSYLDDFEVTTGALNVKK